MFKNILIPVDFSKHNHETVTAAQALADRNKGQITLLHVIELIAETDRHGELDSFYDDLEGQAIEKFTPLQALAAQANCEVVFGDRVEEILNYADSHDVDLIVMSSRRVDPQNPGENLGTISQRIGILAQCPVLLMK
ncbi:MAG: universal stress protein [Caldilineaceae bacterium]|nr:universal stress protein [Caldilineaceae bacterium]